MVWPLWRLALFLGAGGGMHFGYFTMKVMAYPLKLTRVRVRVIGDQLWTPHPVFIASNKMNTSNSSVIKNYLK